MSSRYCSCRQAHIPISLGGDERRVGTDLKEARESLYWIELLKRNNYIDEKQYQSIYEDCEELVKILVSRCKKLDQQINEEK